MGETSEFAINAVPILLGLGLIWYIINTIRSYLRLRQFKGPNIAGFSNIWIFSSTLRGELNERTADILKDHGSYLTFLVARIERSSLTKILCVGPLARIGPNILVILLLRRRLFSLLSYLAYWLRQVTVAVTGVQMA